MSFPSDNSTGQSPLPPPDLAPSLCPIVNPVTARRVQPAPARPTPPQAPAPQTAPPPPSSIPSRRVKLSRRDLANMTSQLAIMLKSGVDVASALQSMVRQSRRSDQTNILRAVHAEVLAGRSFSASLLPYEHIFGPSYVATVAAGEASGQMAEILGQLASLLRSQQRLRNSVRMLLAYPLLLLLVSMVVTVAIVVFVLPRFAEIFAQFDMPLPALTQILLTGATEFRQRYWIWCPLLAILLGSAVAFRLSPPGRTLWDAMLVRGYFVRDVSRMLLMGRICRLLGLMVNSGVPLLESLQIVQASVNNSLYREVLADLEHDVLNGRGLADVLTGSDIVPHAAAEMLVTAEQTGNLGSVTQLIGEHFEEEGETRLRDIVTLIEPVITITMGLVVAIVVASVMLPMFDMATFAQG